MTLRDLLDDKVVECIADCGTRNMVTYAHHLSLDLQELARIEMKVSAA